MYNILIFIFKWTDPILDDTNHHSWNIPIFVSTCTYIHFSYYYKLQLWVISVNPSIPDTLYCKTQ